MRRLLLLLPLLFLAACSAPRPQSLPDFLEAVYAAYGGKAALAGVTTVAARGRIDDELRGVSGGYTRLMERPGRLRIEIRPEQGGEVRVLDGAQGWAGDAFGLTPARPLALASMKYQYAYLDVPMSLANGRASARDGGLQQLDGETLRLLLVETPDAPLLKVWVDPVGHLVRRVAADFDMGPLGRSELGTGYADFRAVDGVLFPFALTNYAGGGRISRITLESLAVNAPLPVGSFVPR